MYLNGCLKWEMVSAGPDKKDALCFFNHDNPQAVLGTKTNNKRVMKRSRNNIVLMCKLILSEDRREKSERKSVSDKTDPAAVHVGLCLYFNGDPAS